MGVLNCRPCVKSPAGCGIRTHGTEGETIGQTTGQTVGQTDAATRQHRAQSDRYLVSIVFIGLMSIELMLSCRYRTRPWWACWDSSRDGLMWGWCPNCFCGVGRVADAQHNNLGSCGWILTALPKYCGSWCGLECHSANRQHNHNSPTPMPIRNVLLSDRTRMTAHLQAPPLLRRQHKLPPNGGQHSACVLAIPSTSICAYSTLCAPRTANSGKPTLRPYRIPTRI